jgi:hypothetical protein
MPNYQRTIIYKIICNDLNIIDLYVGSTTNFTRRKCDHKRHCCNESDKKYNTKIYKIIRDNGGWDNWSMLEIEKYPCNDNNEARFRERYWYEQLKSTMNSIKPALYYHNESSKSYYINNSEKIKNEKKLYYKNNTELYLEKQRAYHHLNKEKLNMKVRLRRDNYAHVYCDCGGHYRVENKNKHIITKIHNNYLLSHNNVSDAK